MKVKKAAAAGIAVFLIFAVVGALEFFHVFDYLEYKAYDFRVKLFANSYKPSDEIVVILLDQNSIDWGSREKGWSWPWPREAYAEITKYMNAGGAKSLAFDVLFSEPSLYRDDDTFIKASKDYGRVVQTVFFSTQTGSSETWPADLKKPLFNPGGFDPVIDNYDLTKSRTLSVERVGAQFPIPGLSASAAALGNVTNAEDFDGINRRARLFVNFDGKAVPGLSAASLLASGGSETIVYNKKESRIEWDNTDGTSYTIPVDSQGKSILRFRGSLNRYIPYSAADILKSAGALADGKDPVYYPEEFRDKYVFFGFYAPGLFDICSNPLESVYPGMGIHITMLDNILSGDFIREIPRWADWVTLFVFVLAVTVLVLFNGKLYFSIGGTALIAALIVVFSLVAYHFLCIWFPLVLPLTGLLVSFLSGTIYNYATEGSQRRFIKSAFSQYLSPIYIDQLISNPSQLRLGGERREISIFFSDVQGFTTISESLDPDQLKELLNDYLTLLSNIIQDSGGTIDKYEGDAIIAFWNAPLNLEDHAARALAAAL